MARAKQKQAITGHLDLLILAVVADGDKHGYAVIEALKARSDDVFDLPEGTVYPALHRLETAGLLTSEWSEVNGRRRRTYQLSDEGTAALQERRTTWSAFSRAVDKVLGGAPWPVTT
jgi:DNA-binding PadR family transcriptional regulator